MKTKSCSSNRLSGLTSPIGNTPEESFKQSEERKIGDW